MFVNWVSYDNQGIIVIKSLWLYKNILFLKMHIKILDRKIICLQLALKNIKNFFKYALKFRGNKYKFQCTYHTI